MSPLCGRNNNVTLARPSVSNVATVMSSHMLACILFRQNHRSHTTTQRPWVIHAGTSRPQNKANLTRSLPRRTPRFPSCACSLLTLALQLVSGLGHIIHVRKDCWIESVVCFGTPRTSQTTISTGSGSAWPLRHGVILACNCNLQALRLLMISQPASVIGLLACDLLRRLADIPLFFCQALVPRLLWWWRLRLRAILRLELQQLLHARLRCWHIPTGCPVVTHQLTMKMASIHLDSYSLTIPSKLVSIAGLPHQR
jgi:hypothetical protein